MSRPAHYRIIAAGVKMLVGGKWIVLPNETIQYRTLASDTGETAGRLSTARGLIAGFMVVSGSLGLFWQGKMRTRRQREHALMLAKARASDAPPLISSELL